MYVVAEKYDGQEYTVDGETEEGYLNVGVGEFVTASSEVFPGHASNRYSQYIFAALERHQSSKGWVPVSVLNFESPFIEVEV